VKNLLTKKKVFWVSLTFAALLLLWDYIGNVKLCTLGGRENDYHCLNTISDFELVFFPVLSLALLSIFTYFMRDEIFSTWIKFAKWWVPLSMIAIFFAPEDIPGSFSVPVKGPLAFFTTFVLFICSIFLILFSVWELHRTHHGRTPFGWLTKSIAFVIFLLLTTVLAFILVAWMQ